MSGSNLGPKVLCSICREITQSKTGAHVKCRRDFERDFGYSHDDGLKNGHWTPGRHGILEWVQVGVA